MMLTRGPSDANLRDAALRQARTCWDHFAGRLGVALTDGLTTQGHIELTGDAGIVTPSGIALLENIGIAMEPILAGRTERTGQVLCRSCYDWSEHGSHLAGTIGAAICAHSMRNGWTRPMKGSRAVQITPKGEHVFREKFGAKLSYETNKPLNGTKPSSSDR
jgi:hypothetical protein